ncbi:hypothetical protein SNEBB_002813 [Seison nebaliae]|nr:hypothetical protein SNEBB_002813 [Seison nebaliae]
MNLFLYSYNTKFSDQYPYIYPVGDNFEGLAYDIITSIYSTGGISFVQNEDNILGDITQNMAAAQVGIVKSLVDGVCDIGIGPWSSVWNKFDYLTLSDPYASQRIAIAYSKHIWRKRQFFTFPFDLKTSIIILSLTFFIIIILSAISRYESIFEDPKLVPIEQQDMTQPKKNLMAFSFALGRLFLQNIELELTIVPGRMIVAAWSVFTAIIAICFLSQLVGNELVQLDKPKVEFIDDLLLYDVAIRRGSNLLEFFSTIDVYPYKQIFDKINNNPYRIFSDMDSIKEELLDDNNLIVIGDTLELHSTFKHNQSFKVEEKLFDTHQLSFAFKKNYEHFGEFNRRLRIFRENGILDFFTEKYRQVTYDRYRNPLNVQNRLLLFDVYPFFYIVGIGSLLSLLILPVELLIWKAIQKPKVRAETIMNQDLSEISFHY